jgi:hypothetical protein
MNARIVALAVMLALGTLAAPVAFDFDLAPNASAARCLIGDGCIIPINCVRDCDCDPWKQYFRECGPPQ